MLGTWEAPQSAYFMAMPMKHDSSLKADVREAVTEGSKNLTVAHGR